MRERTPTNCPECGITPGTRHTGSCDVARCTRCGGQAISCDCVYIVNGLNPGSLTESVYSNGPTAEMMDRLDKEFPVDVWSGIWPGVAECIEYGFWCTRGPNGFGWVRCSASEEGATEDLNRLTVECNWDQEKQKWVKK